MNDRLRAGVYGTGPDALWSAARMRLQEDIGLVAVADADPATLDHFVAETGVGIRCDDFDALLQTGIDVVILAGARRDRVARVEAAAAQGVHCLLHAPMALTGADAAAMLAATTAANLRLGVLVRAQGDPVFDQLRQMLAGDWLGGVVYAQSLAGENGLLRQPPTAGDPRLDALIAHHPLLQLAAPHVHLASWLIGNRPVSVTTQTTTGFLPLPADSAVATVQLRGGVLCSFAATHLLAANQFAIHGTDGFVRIAGDRIVLQGKKEYRGPVFDYPDPGTELALLRRDVAAAVEQQAAAAELHGRFARWIDDRDDFPCPGEQATADMRVFDAIARAMTSGQAEAVDGGQPRQPGTRR